jgi:Ca-activated chloride channel family protein
METLNHPLPDLFRNSQLIVVGKYTPGGPGTLAVSGTFMDGPATMQYQVEFAKTVTADAAFLGRLWAQRRIGFLADQIRKSGSSKEIAGEIAALGMRFGIVFNSPAYVSLMKQMPVNAPIFALGQNVTFVHEGQAYSIVER